MPRAEHPAPGVAEHYDRHLGPVYSWMVGDFAAACQSTAEYFDAIDLRPFSTRVAVDLGCAHGLQAIPLARRGYAVTAIDTCRHLLDTLSTHADGLPIKAVHDDLRNFAGHVEGPVDAIVCMGDTLTHLATMDEVVALLVAVSARLAPGGTFCASFRDYSAALVGPSRFIPVRSDDERICTCFLEFDSQTVHVYDMLYDRKPGGWTMSVSSYDKLRLSPGWVIDAAGACGLELRHEAKSRGMLHFAFEHRAA
ncbi:MAG: methyltransferase domain-containing protein [Planctomycetota bacterium]|nr:MAG: methyltransferase domain-containing protein [Planctomycetota bacterium]